MLVARSCQTSVELSELPWGRPTSVLGGRAWGSRMKRLVVGVVAVGLVACGSSSGDVRTADSATSSEKVTTSIPESHRAEFCRLLDRLDSASSSRQLRIVATDLGTLADDIEDDTEAFDPRLLAATSAIRALSAGASLVSIDDVAENQAKMQRSADRLRGNCTEVG